MEIVDSQNGSVTVAEVRGRVDSGTAKAFEEKLLGLLTADGSTLVVECSALDYISSAGLRVLLMAAKRARAGKGKMALSGLKPHVREVFDVSGFSGIFAIHPTRDAAVAAIQG